MASSPARRRARWHLAIAAAVALALMALLASRVDLAGVWSALTRAHLGLVLLAVLVTVSSYVLRTWRWQVLLAPLGPVAFGPAFRMTLIGCAAMALLPARAGDLVRPYLLARRQGFRATAAFATVVIERLLDLVTVLLMFGAFLLMFDLSTVPLPAVDVRAVTWAGTAAAVAALAGLVIMFIVAGQPERMFRVVERIERALPTVARLLRLAKLVRAFADGSAVMRRPGDLVRAALLSAPLWLTNALAIWLVSRAFDLTYPFAGAFLVTMFLTVGVAVPTPGAIGGFHAMYVFALTGFFGAPSSVALAAALVLHAVAYLPVTVLGLAAMTQEGLTLSRLSAMREAPPGGASA